MPAQMSFRILPAIDVCEMVDDSLSEEQNLEWIYEHVLSVMQDVHLREYRQRRFPILG